jgi:flagellin
MVNNSIYTNPSAYTALQNLSVVNRKLEISQGAISSGLRVASATDNTSSFAIAQGIRGEIGSIEATKRTLTKVKGIVDYTLAATEGISNLVGELKEKLSELQDTTLSTSQRNILVEDFHSLLSQGKDLARGTANLDQVAGVAVDLFSTSGLSAVADVAVNLHPLTISGIATTANGVVTIDSATTIAVFNRLTSLQTAARTGTAANATSTITTDFVTFEQEIATALGHLGGKSEHLANHAQFLEAVKSSRQELLGSYVDADLAAESAKLTALQVQQQLAVQAVGIANQRPQSLLGLFR